MSWPSGVELGPRSTLLLRALALLRWPIALVASTGILAWVIATDDEMVLKGPVRVRLTLDQPLPVSAAVSEIEAPIPTQPLQATVKLPDGVQLATPVAVQVPQLSKPLKAEVSGAVAAQVAGSVAAQVSGSVDATVDGEVEAEIPKPIKHERIRLGL
ncbi:hypothetical protein KUL97_00805 [Synechococcus sp. HK05]|uniref:hypothetical protein n=1 Tax=Synechococcus sp. HK05 TaxID=2725975 RepID=UPI001C38B5EF|nr:hypothetical protein [Synechococcus sp. HK05]MBV2350240.1 hypothetical protein [Synechococcus sp. HK05]